jgi:hypothetical protein
VEVIRWVLILLVSVSIYWPLNIPLAALAYKVRLGPRPLPMETSAFWTRATFVALGLAVLAAALMFLDYGLVTGMEMPAAIVHLGLFLLYLPVAVWYVFWMFALDDLLEAFSLLLIYLCLPGFVLALLWQFDVQLPLALADSWFVKPS